MTCDNGQFLVTCHSVDINGNSSSDENEPSNERFDLNSVKQSLNSLKEIVKANQPTRAFEGLKKQRYQPQPMEISRATGVHGEQVNSVPRSVNINRRSVSRDLNANEQQVNDNDVTRSTTILAGDTRSHTIDNDHPRIRNINKGNVHVLKKTFRCSKYK